MNKIHSRRDFLSIGAIVAGGIAPALGLTDIHAQSDTPTRPKPDPGGPSLHPNGTGNGQGQSNPFPPVNPRRDPTAAEENAPTPDRKEVLKANDKDIKSNVLKLAELAEELKREVEKTDSANVLSLPMVHKAEEIERLAKHIATLARG